MDNSFNSVPLMYLFVLTININNFFLIYIFVFLYLDIFYSALCKNRNSFNILHNIATFVLAWGLSVMLHYKALHSTIAGLGQPSWPAQPGWPAPSPQPGPRPDPVIWGQHSSGEQNIILLLQKIRLLDFSVSHFARSSKKGHPLTLCCPWLGSVCSGVYDILAVRVDTSDGHYLGQKLSILFMPNSCPERVLECQFTGGWC